MPGQSHEQGLMNASEELNQLSMRRQQLTDRRNVLALLIEFKQSSGQNEQQYSRENAELQDIEKQLEALSERKIQLQMTQERLGETHNNIIAEVTDTTVAESTVSSGIVFVEHPPSFPAPKVILNVEELPEYPSQTQCPFCHQYITTEVTKTNGSTSCLVCFILILFCCVAGCCLIPFCLDRFKNTVHKCPRCRSRIHTCKKL